MVTQGCIEALLAALCWSLCALCFTSASHRVGSLTVNFVRIVMALVLLIAWNWIETGSPLPPPAPARTWVCLGLSGFIGFFLGDMCLVRAFMLIGPRRALLVMTLWPALAAAAGWVVLGEGLTLRAIVGIAITLGGIIWVERERTGDVLDVHRSVQVKGIIFAVLGAVGQASGFVLSKAGMSITDTETGITTDYHAVAANVIRASVACVAFTALHAALHRWRQLGAAVRHRHALACIFLGAILGPFVGVVFALRAMQHAPVGIASALVSTAPVMIVPFSMLFYKEKVTMRAIAGACIVIVGVCLLFMYK